MPDTVPDETPLLIGERCFSDVDQQWFAEASGDVNPMHVDAVAARRLLSGRQVVHGMHTLVQALDLWRSPSGQRPHLASCSFDNPVSVGDRVVFSQRDDAQGGSVLTATVDGLVCTELTLRCGDAAALPGQRSAMPPASADAPARQVGGLTAPLDEPAGSQAGQRMLLTVDAPGLAEVYCRAAALLGPKALAALAGLSYFVGMVCPGQHSVFSSLQFVPGADPAAGLVFTLRRYDPRFRLFDVAFDGCLKGQLRAFLRPPPQPQPGAAELAMQVRPQEFSGSRSLVVGGSRGLGELTAKLLAVGGGKVVISYARGRDDALRVAADIAAAGLGGCEAIALDLDSTGFASLPLPVDALTAVYYFATPRIYKKKAEVFDRAAFDEFCRYYLDHFTALCRWLDTRTVEPRVKVYLPSTVFIDDRPKGMAEYAMAKAAAEVLADDLNRSLRHVEVVCTRLPRLATDQTASIMKVEVGSNVDTLLPVLRRMHGPA